MKSIELTLFYRVWDTYGILYFNFSNLSLSNNILSSNIPKKYGYNTSAINIKRKLYELETIYNAKEYEYYFYENQSKMYEILLPFVYFDPDYVLTGNTHTPIPDEKRTTTLSVQGINPVHFCRNYYPEYSCLATRCFYCHTNNQPKIESNAKPENFITQIRGSTSPGKLKVIRLDFQNECQEIYGQFKPQDAILDFYIPIDGNKTITIKYNNVSYPHNSNLKIDKNPFDYTLKNFIIPGNKIIPNGIAEIWYDGKNIYNFTITYSNVVLPPLIQRIHRINTFFPIPNPLTIRFSEPIKIGANEVRNRFHLCDGGRCVLQSDNITLKCDNPQIIDCLFYEGMCGTQAMDYYIEYYTPPHNSQYLSRKYYVLPGNKKLIHFYYEIGSENSTFPLKVYVNDEEVTIMKTLYGKRQYYYSTNKPGNYYIYVLDHNKILTGPVETVYVRNHISDFFPTFKSDNTCIYYNEEGTFRFMNNDFVDLNYIYANVYKYHFSIFYCPFCFWNI